MSPTQQTALLRLYGLGSLAEATRENWPWWRYKSCTRCGDSTYDHWCNDGEVAYIPDLTAPTPEANATAVQVAERVGAELHYCAKTKRWTVLAIELPLAGLTYAMPFGPDGFPAGDTLGQALMAALEVQR